MFDGYSVAAARGTPSRPFTVPVVTVGCREAKVDEVRGSNSQFSSKLVVVTSRVKQIYCFKDEYLFCSK